MRLKTDNGDCPQSLWAPIWAAMFALVLIMAFSASSSPVRSFEAESEDGVMLRQGDYLLQNEGEKPVLCRTHARVVARILEIRPDARIERHALGNGTMWLFADYRDMTGEMFALGPGGLVCENYPLYPPAYVALRTLVDAPDRKFEVLPVWPEP